CRPHPMPPPHSFPTRRSSDLAFVRARSLGKTDDRQLLDQVAARVQLFQLVGVDVLPGRVEDDVLLAPPQREVKKDVILDASGKKDRKSTRLNSSHLGISYAVF